MGCPECGSEKTHETQQVWTPEGVKAYRCTTCYHTWWSDYEVNLIGIKGIRFRPKGKKEK